MAITPTTTATYNQRLLWELLAITTAVMLLWTTPLVWPLKMLVIFFHELSHALAALATGGDVVAIHLSLNEGGLAITRGGNRFLILTAGYLGSLLWGAGLLILASKFDDDRPLIRALGVLLLAVTLICIRNWFGFGFGLATGLALWFGAKHLPPFACDLLLKTIGLVSCLYVIPDIWSDTIARSSLPSDARMLAELTLIPTVVWGLIWIVIAGIITTWALRISLAHPPPAALID